VIDTIRSFRPLRTLLLRATLLWALVSMLLYVVSRLASPDGEPAGSNPIGTLLLCLILGAVDLRRRHEGILWANLGFPASVTVGVYGAAAGAGEILLSVVRG
jgi:hypothetical protein